jgi:hypothetical protein
MRGSKAIAGVGLVWSIALAGCMSAGGTNRGSEMTARGGRPSAALAQSGSGAAPDLRIPANAGAAGPEIPIVPVPPVPLGGDRSSKSGVQPTSFRQTVPPTPPADPPADRASSPDAPPARHTLRELVRMSSESYAGINDYIARLTRRENVGGKAKPEEVMMFLTRKDPWSVHFKWIGDVGRGREVIYVKGQYENKIHTLLAAGDAPFMPAGKRLALAPDSVMVRSASRHHITEAGIGSAVDHLALVLAAQERGDTRRGTLRLLEPQNRIEFPRPVEAIESVIPAGLEPELPRGGRRTYFFDPERHLPVLITARDETGAEVEYYRFDRLQLNVGLDNLDFNPDHVWAKPKPAPKGPSGDR